MAEKRYCRAKGYDWHGVVVERLVKNIGRHPGQVVKVAMRSAWRCFIKALIAQLPDREDEIMKKMPTPRKLWEREQLAMVQTPKMKKGRILHHREFLEKANHGILRTLFPEFFTGGEGKKKLHQVAREVRKLRRQRRRMPYAMNKDVRGLLVWDAQKHGAPNHIVSGQERHRILEVVRRKKVPRKYFARVNGIITAGDLGANKLSPQFWVRLLARLKLKAHEFLMIGNEVPIDGACTQVGISCIIFDRGSIRKEFYRTNEALRKDLGVPFIFDLDEEIPSHGPFIAFAKDTEELQKWLERIPYLSRDK